MSGDPGVTAPHGLDRIPAESAAVFLVRHAKAVDREQWTEDDRLRPLTKKGRRQAEGLVHLFRRLDLTRVVTSPYLRCVQTVRPLALARGLAVELSDYLAEGAAIDDALGLVTSTPDGSVLCSHGDIIPATLERLAGAGVEIAGEAGWKKGSTWILRRSGGRFVLARYVPPPIFD